MSDFFLMLAGVAGMLIAIAHGLIGHHKILKHVSGVSPTLLHVNYAVFQMSTVYWFVGGIGLLLAPFLLDPAGRFLAAVTVSFLYVVGAAGNVWSTRGRHFGGYALIVTAMLALLGR